MSIIEDIYQGYVDSCEKNNVEPNSKLTFMTTIACIFMNKEGASEEASLINFSMHEHDMTILINPKEQKTYAMHGVTEASKASRLAFLERMQNATSDTTDITDIYK